MRYYFIEPEVAGGLGPQTVMEEGPNRPTVTDLHYVFDGWLGDEIVESTPCFIVTGRLADNIRDNGLTGTSTATVRIGRSETFDELYADRGLPEFVWLKVGGERNTDDFFVADDGRLVISERALRVIAPCAPNAVVTEYL
jgi:hypothetical protein